MRGRAITAIKRMAIIQARAWEARAEARVYEPVADDGAEPVTLQEAWRTAATAIAKSGHSVIKQGGGFLCQSCWKWRKHLVAWTKTRCIRLNAAQLAARHHLGRRATRLAIAKSAHREDAARDAEGRLGCKRQAEEQPVVLLARPWLGQVPEGAAGTAEAILDDDMDAEAEAEPYARQEAQPHAAHPFAEPPAWEGEEEEHVHADGVRSVGTESLHGVADDQTEDDAVREAADEAHRRVRRRLCAKTPAADTSYGGPGLLTLREAQAEAAARTAKRRKVAAANRATHAKAWNLLELNVGAAYSTAADEGSDETTAHGGPTFHCTHDVRRSRDIGIVFCEKCAAWSSGRKAKKLLQPCEGRCMYLGLLRLLQLGIYPSAGATIPREQKAPGSRGTRRGSGR